MNALYCQFTSRRYQKHPMFSIPSWSKAGEEYCTVNKALWVRILDSNMLTSTFIKISNVLPQYIVSQYIAFIGLYWRRNHAAVFFLRPPLQPLHWPCFILMVTMVSLYLALIGLFWGRYHVAHLITFVTMVSLYNAH